MGGIKHAFVSSIADGGDTTLVRPSNWNADHLGLNVLKVNSDVSNTTVTLADITDLSIPVEINKFYAFEFILAFTSAASATGIRVDITGPDSPNMIAWRRETGLGIAITAGTDNVQMRDVSSYGGDAATANAPCPQPTMIKIAGVFQCGSNSGNLKVQFASEVAASSVTIKGGSGGIWW